MNGLLEKGTYVKQNGKIQREKNARIKEKPRAKQTCKAHKQNAFRHAHSHLDMHYKSFKINT